ncbi:MAG: hypothetical protein AAF268_06255 [Cyanobacteria bacterium P01_A01_bin.3]
MDRSKLVAVFTGALALLLSIGYLLLVQLLDFRGEFKPAPIEVSTLVNGAIANICGLLDYWHI